MNDFFLVDVPDTGDKLREKFCGILFFEVSVGKDVVKELASGGVLEDDANVLVSLDYVVETDDVWMFERLEGEFSGGVRTEVGEKRRTRRTSISRSTFERRRGLSTFPRRMSLTATSSPHSTWMPSLTLPNSPSPRVWRRR